MEIKFRAWHKRSKTWEDNSGMFDPMVDEESEENYPAYYIPNMITLHDDSDMYDFNLFTGIKDKNGREIYQGDILTYISSSMSSMTVEFKDGAFVGVGPFNTLPLNEYLLASDFESIEVVGNIYENSTE